MFQHNHHAHRMFSFVYISAIGARLLPARRKRSTKDTKTIAG